MVVKRPKVRLGDKPSCRVIMLSNYSLLVEDTCLAREIMGLRKEVMTV